MQAKRSFEEYLPLVVAAWKNHRGSQRDFAQQVGCSQSQVSRMLTGKVKTMHGYALTMLEKLGILPEPSPSCFGFEHYLDGLAKGANERQKALIEVIRHTHSLIPEITHPPSPVTVSVPGGTSTVVDRPRTK